MRRLSAIARRLAWLLPMAATAAGVVASPAAAAPYAITRCTYSKLPTSPAGTRAPVLTPVGTVPNDLCGAGYGLRFDFPNHVLKAPTSSRLGMRFTLPPNTPDLTILSVSARLTLLAKSGDSSSSGSLAFVDETNAASATIASWGGGATPAIGPTDFTTPASWKPSRSVLLGASCATACTFTSGTERDLKIEKLSFVLDDPSPPAEPIFNATGLLAPGSVQGVQPLSIATADDGSGVDRVEVLTPAGAMLAGTPARDGCYLNYAEACPPARTVSVPIDTAVLLPGTQRLTVRIVNGAGLTRTIETPPFTVPGAPAAPILVPNGESLGAAQITARKGSPGKKPAVSVAFGRSVRLRGQLLDAKGQPMPGVALDLLRTPVGVGATRSIATTVSTDPKGTYDIRYRAEAPAKLELAYAKHRGAGDYETAKALTVAVVPNVALRAARSSARRGAKAKLTGQILFAPQPPAGTLVGIQVLRGGRWQTIDVVSLRDGGRFTWTHAFNVRGRYRFRARTFKSSSLPRAVSAPAALRVR